MDAIRHRKICHAYKEKRETTYEGRIRITKVRKDKNPRRKAKLQIFDKNRSGHHQTCRDERRKLKRVSQENEETKLRRSLNKFPDFFRMGTFIDSIHMKL